MCITSGTYHDARHAFISAICWRHFRGVNKPLSFPQLLNTEMQLYIVVHVHTHTHIFNMDCINICLIISGASPGFGWGGGQDFFFRFGNLHVAKRHAAHGEAMRIARGVRGHAPPRKFFKSVQFGAF